MTDPPLTPFDAAMEAINQAGGTTPTEPDPLRDLAVKIVDTLHGYTAEYAPDPDGHREEYGAVEGLLLNHIDRAGGTTPCPRS